MTGSPPYIPVGSGLPSPHPQRAGARLELAGSVHDYCAAARRWLAPGGRFCFVFAAGDPRGESAPRAHGLTVLERIDDDHVTTQRNLLFVERASGTMRSAVYDDELVRTPEGWRIASTRCRFIVADGLADRPAD